MTLPGQPSGWEHLPEEGVGAMKLCPHCTASIEDDSAKCPRCGRWVVPKRDVSGSRKKGGVDRKRLFLLGALLLFAWALWRIPESPINPRERLNLKPTMTVTLRSMESDLETLGAMQERYFQVHGSYSGSPSVLGFEASRGVTVSLIVTPTGWKAAATHEEFGSNVGCAVYGGSSSPPRSPISPSEPGVVECTGGAA